MVGVGCTAPIAAQWLPSFQAAMDRFEISSTPQRIAALLANVGVESGGLAVLVENLNYSAQGLANTWPNRYSTGEKVQIPGSNPPKFNFVPNDLANSLNRNPEAIANNVYANRMGNGDASSGDGWAHRGAGPIQLTGKDVQMSFMMDCDVDMVNSPQLIQQPAAGALSAAWFFAVYKKCLPAIDAADFAGVVRLINGQAPCEANSGPLRVSRYSDCIRALKM
ncbi:endolysin glycosyl hydrolase [Burkholderia phage vB_BglM_WTB]